MSLPRLTALTSKWWKSLLTAVFITLTWLYLWYFPWQNELHHIYWLQLGTGMAIFILPGFCVYGLLSDYPRFNFSHVTFGFTISLLIFALLGIVGRLLNLPFTAIKFIMMILGSFLILAFVLPIIDRGIKFHVDRKRSSYFIYAVLVLLASLLVIIIVIQRALTDDDLTYFAYATHLQHSTALDFKDPVFGESYLATQRFWLMSAPFAQALLASISNIPGILMLSGYYEPFLIILSVLSWYELAITLKLSPRAASVSVFLQLSFMILFPEYLHPGSPYLNQLSTDKAMAAFILAPVFFQSLIRMLKRPAWKSMVLFILTGLSLTFMHPIILAFAVFIGGMLILLDKGRKDFRFKLISILVLILVLAPQIMIRFASVPGVMPIELDPDVILDQRGTDSLVFRWENTPFYGFNPDILTMEIPYEENIPLPITILQWGWILIPISAFVLALRQRDNGFAQYIISGFMLCALTAFPLTGWIFGYFLNARMLARSIWLFPYGLSAVFLFSAIRGHSRQFKKHSPTRQSPASSNWAFVIFTVFTIGLFLLYMRENNLPDFEKFNNKVQRYKGLAIAGQTVDDRIIDQAFVIGSTNLNDLIPGISSKSKLITFRNSNPSNMPYFTSAEREERAADTGMLFSKSTSAEDKLSLLEKYDVQFLFLQRDDIRFFNDLTTKYPDRIKPFEVGGVILVEIE